MSRKTDILYKENKTKVIAYLEGKQSEIATKLVQKYNEFDMLQQQAREFKRQASETMSQANEKKSEYEIKLRDIVDEYFDVSIDSAKTRVIETQSFIIKIAREETEARESKFTDYEAAFNDIIKLMNIPLEVVNQVLEKNTTIELSLPKAKLYAPVDKSLTEATDERTSFLLRIKNQLASFYKTILNKFKIFDKAMTQLEKKYL